MQNPAFSSEHDPYYTQEKRFIFHLVPDGPNLVLDLGCGAGKMGKALIDSGKAGVVVGVEIFEPAAHEAAKYYSRVHVGDIEQMELTYHGYFDVAICGDILEHLKDPGKVIQRVRQWLKDDGLIICCVPNVRYWRVLRDLIFRGKFEYASEGIMDQTHLRFFTCSSFKKLLRDASFEIKDEGMRIAVGPKQATFNRLTGGIFREFLGIQMLYPARKV